MKKYKWLAMVLVVAFNVWGCAEKETTAKKELDVHRENVVSIATTVEKVDLKKRLVTLRGPEGNLRTIHVGKEVVNLPQVHVGDQVIVDYVESLAVRMAKPGEVRDEVQGMIERAKPGQKPGYAEEAETTVTAAILNIDKKQQTVTLKAPDGEVVVAKVQDPANLDKVKVGDMIVITYTEAMAIAVRSVK